MPDSYTKLLLHGDGSNLETHDKLGKVLTFNGDASISSTKKKMGGTKTPICR